VAGQEGPQVPVLPGTVAEKRDEALRRANAVRVARAALNRSLAAGQIAIEDVVAQPPSCAQQAKVYDLVRAVPGIGPARSLRLLVKCQIPHAKTLAALSDRQRRLLIASLREARPQRFGLDGNTATPTPRTASSPTPTNLTG
jgi:hypothetical protein